MDLGHVRTFLEIARLGSFRLAAAHLNVSQSTVSARIAELERSLGVSLFDRSRRRVALSEEGRRFLEPAEGIVGAVEHAEVAMSSSAGLSRRLRIGAVEVIAASWLPMFLSRLMDRHPRAPLEIVVRPTLDLLQRFNVGDLDLLLVPEMRSVPNRASASLGRIEWQLATALSDDPGPDGWTPSVLADRRIATLGEGSLIGPAITDWLRGAGVRNKRTITCESVSVLSSIIRSGSAVGALPRHFDDRFDHDLAFHSAPGPFPKFSYVASYRPEAAGFMKDIARLAAQASTFPAR